MVGQIIKFQIGKNGLTDYFIETLKKALEKHKRLRISVLKNSVRDKNKVKEIANELDKKIENCFISRIIGFTIIIGRRKDR